MNTHLLSTRYPVLPGQHLFARGGAAFPGRRRTTPQTEDSAKACKRFVTGVALAVCAPDLAQLRVCATTNRL